MSTCSAVERSFYFFLSLFITACFLLELMLFVVLMHFVRLMYVRRLARHRYDSIRFAFHVV